jgi:hypothetical protein
MKGRAKFTVAAKWFIGMSLLTYGVTLGYLVALL